MRALLVVIVTGTWLSRALVGPLRELTAGVKAFAAGDCDAKVTIRTRDEIGQLRTAFNGVIERDHAAGSLLDRARLPQDFSRHGATESAELRCRSAKPVLPRNA